MNSPKLSIVSTLYLSAPYLGAFLDRMIAAAREVEPSFEIILVDDGSPDNSLQLAIEAVHTRPEIRVVELSRNFGHHAAILAGLELARGDLVFLIDSDLEEPPELLHRFHELMRQSDADVVYGFHAQKVGSRFRQASSSAFWRIFNSLSESQTQENICHVRLMKRDYLDALLSLKERNLFLGGLYVWAGFKQVAAQVDRIINRPISTYSFPRRIDLAVRSVVAFSTRPLKLIFMLGSTIALLSFLVALTFLLIRIGSGEAIQLGFSSIIISIWLLGGLTIMSLGVIGLYIGQVYVETKARPRSIIRRIHEPANATFSSGKPSE